MTRARFHPLRISAVRYDTTDAVVLTFDVPDTLRDAYRFTPGQYLTLRAEFDGQDIRRSYSLCSAPDEPGLRVGIKRVEGGAFSTWANTALKVGDTLQVMTPDGRFGLAPNPVAARCFAAFVAGSGITPVLSLMKALLEGETDSRFFLFYGNRSTDSIMFRSEIEDLKDRFLARLSVFHVLSREEQDIPVLNGHLDADKLRALQPMLPKIDHAFVCGPQTMIEGLPTVLTALGIPHVHVDASPPRPTPAPAPRRSPPTRDPPPSRPSSTKAPAWTSPSPRGRRSSTLPSELGGTFRSPARAGCAAPAGQKCWRGGWRWR